LRRQEVEAGGKVAVAIPASRGLQLASSSPVATDAYRSTMHGHAPSNILGEDAYC